MILFNNIAERGHAKLSR